MNWIKSASAANLWRGDIEEEVEEEEEEEEEGEEEEEEEVEQRAKLEF